MLHIVGQTKIDFIKPMYFCLAFSVILIAVGAYSLISKKETAYGVDFAGGQLQEYRFEKALSADALRQALKDAGINDAVIQQFDKNPQDVIVRSSEDTYEGVVAAFKTAFKDNKFETMRIEKVGPVVGKALRERAIWAMILALGAILIYVGIRFKNFGFALGGIVALFHDMMMALGISVMMGRQIDLLVVTALLTIAGYSINDTIVIFDRVRENLAKNRKMPLIEVINLSINQTLGRTILTSSVTLLVVISLFLFGGEVLNTFSLTLLIGFMAGVYSTIYIVSPIVVWFQRFRKTSAW
jgi:preprotein translocase SecF subunit